MAFREYIKTYPDYHKHPTNKIFHLIGIPMIIIGIIFFLAMSWLMATLLVLIGSALLVTGHRIEGNKPAASSNPLYILAAPIWYYQEVRDYVVRIFVKNVSRK